MEGENRHIKTQRAATLSSKEPVLLNKTYEYSRLVIKGRAVSSRTQIVAVIGKLSCSATLLFLPSQYATCQRRWVIIFIDTSELTKVIKGVMSKQLPFYKNCCSSRVKPKQFCSFLQTRWKNLEHYEWRESKLLVCQGPAAVCRRQKNVQGQIYVLFAWKCARWCKCIMWTMSLTSLLCSKTELTRLQHKQLIMVICWFYNLIGGTF